MLYPSLYRHFNNLSSISDNEWQLLESKLVYQQFKKGENFEPRDDQQGKADLFGIILEGFFMVAHVDLKGEKRIKYFAGPHQMVGDYFEILKMIPSHSCITALTMAKLLVMSYGEFQKLAEVHPCFISMEKKMAQHFYLLKERREYSFLHYNALERYQEFKKEFPGLLSVLSQNHISSYIGVSPVTLSRLLS